MTVVVVSHDATFLEAVVTDVLLLAHARRQLEAFEGSYSHFRSGQSVSHRFVNSLREFVSS